MCTYTPTIAICNIYTLGVHPDGGVRQGGWPLSNGGERQLNNAEFALFASKTAAEMFTNTTLFPLWPRNLSPRATQCMETPGNKAAKGGNNTLFNSNSLCSQHRNFRQTHAT